MCLSLIRVCSITRRIATLQNMYSLSRNGPARRTRAKPSGNGSLTKRGFGPFSYLSKSLHCCVFAHSVWAFPPDPMARQNYPEKKPLICVFFRSFHFGAGIGLPA